MLAEPAQAAGSMTQTQLSDTLSTLPLLESLASAVAVTEPEPSEFTWAVKAAVLVLLVDQLRVAPRLTLSATVVDG
jgi:hypothetical protein